MSLVWEVKRAQIDPELAADLSELLGASQYNWLVYRGWADSATQKELYMRYLGGGPLAAKPGHSAHECVDKQGLAASLAVDIVRLNEIDVEVWDYATHPAWEWLWAAVKAHPRMHSGHDFPSDTGGRVSADDDHIQAVKWQEYKAKLQAKGEW